MRLLHKTATAGCDSHAAKKRDCNRLLGAQKGLLISIFVPVRVSVCELSHEARQQNCEKVAASESARSLINLINLGPIAAPSALVAANARAHTHTQR